MLYKQPKEPLFLQRSQVRDAAQRSKDLVLSITPLSQSDDKLPSLKSVCGKWTALKSNPNQLLGAVRDYLTLLRKKNYHPKKQFQLVEQTLHFIFPALQSVYSKYCLQSAIPESVTRRQSLHLVISVLQILLDCYKAVYMHDYNASNRQYVRSRTRVRYCAFRILEFIKYVQRFYALRLENLPSRHWQDCNKVFFSVRDCEDVNITFECAVDFQMLTQFTRMESSNKIVQRFSIKEIYLYIQFIGMLDSNCLSLEQLNYCDYYFQRWLNLVDIKSVEEDTHNEAVPSVIGINCDQDCRPHIDIQGSYSAFESSPAKRIVVDTEKFIQRLTEAYQTLLQRFLDNAPYKESNDKKHLSLTDQDETDELIAVTHLRCKLVPAKRSDDRDHYNVVKQIEVFSGFNAIYKTITAITKNNPPGIKLELVEEIERDADHHSAFIIQHDERLRGGAWYIENESDKGLVLETKECAETAGIYIGQLIVALCGNEHNALPILGYINRIQRRDAGYIKICVVKLAKSVCCAVVQTDYLREKDLALPGLLMLDEEQVPQLILHHSHRVECDTHLSVFRGRDRMRFGTTNIKLIQREFQEYELEPINE